MLSRVQSSTRCRQACSYALRHLSTNSADIELTEKYNKFTIEPQDIYAGTEVLSPFVEDFLSLGGGEGHTLIVTDPGVVSVGVLDQVLEGFKAAGHSPAVFDQTKSDPSVHDVADIAAAYTSNNCNRILALGGGGPLDAGKAAAAVIAAIQSNLATGPDDLTFIPELGSRVNSNRAQWEAAVPVLGGIPTTSGTGSEAGKSSVICNLEGKKMVFGDMALMPKIVALVPQLTSGMPAPLTAATGVDALFHCMEALFVTNEDARLDGMNPEETAQANRYAMRGMSLVLQHLARAVTEGNHLSTRLNMQLASMYGAKAFRKGALGGVHATAHSLGAHFHIHHGTAIGRMSEAVLHHTQPRATEETLASYNAVSELFTNAGFADSGAGLAPQVGQFLGALSLPRGISSLQPSTADLERLTVLAAADPCQTNPVQLTAEDYRSIYEYAQTL